MLTRLCDILHTATSSLPVDLSNHNVVQDSLGRLRELLSIVDGCGLYLETDKAPEYLVKTRSNLFGWIQRCRDSK